MISRSLSYKVSHYLDKGEHLNGSEVMDFIPSLFDAMMKTHLKTVVDAYSPVNPDSKNFGRRHRMVDANDKNTFLVSRIVNDSTGIRYRVRVTRTKDDYCVPALYYYNVSMSVVDTNLTKSYEFTTGPKRYGRKSGAPKEKGIGYAWFIGTGRVYDGSIPFTEFLVESLTEFNTKSKDIDDKMQAIKNKYAEMKKAVDRF